MVGIGMAILEHEQTTYLTKDSRMMWRRCCGAGVFLVWIDVSSCDGSWT